MIPADAAARAVLMGDIVKSRSAGSPRALHRTFNSAIDHFNERYEGRLASPLTITLGDEFQGLLATLSDAFELLHRLRLYLLDRTLDCRFVLGQVRLATPLNAERAWNMMGEGLSEARQMLGDKADLNAYRFSLPAQGLLQDLLNTQGFTLSYVESQWTRTQQRYFDRLSSRGEQTMAELAGTLEVSERNLYNVLRAGHRELYERQLGSIRRALAALDEAGDR